jgi:Acyl-CoA synthetases (AMP-forming)/AMP-acid ligases II
VSAETDESMTYDELYTRSLSVARYLQTQGIKPGDAIGICSENSIEYYLPILASFFIGATCVPLNPMYTTRK